MGKTYANKRLLTAAIALILVLAGCASPVGTFESAAETLTPATASTTPTPTPVPATTPKESATPEPSPTPVYAGQAVCIANEPAGVFAAGNTEAEVLGELPAGETADVIEYGADWAHIVYGGIAGYVQRGDLLGLHSPDIAVPSGEWTLLPVSQASPLPEGYNAALADLEGKQVDARILDIVAAMFADAAEDGAELTLDEGYRSFETQRAQYEAKVQKYLAQGYSQREAEIEAATIIARPGTSEHQTGLALDIVTPQHPKQNEGFAQTLAYQWLWANAANYGFILRYPDGKTDITGIIYEPWHWRFVGAEAAQAMRQSGQCFEEYLGG
jgi:D-alanyl-D-alanine carboxypeptidase